MILQYVCSSGFVVRTEKGGFAVDAPNALCDPYRSMDREEALALSLARGKYKGIEALLFTHSHPDHRDTELSKSFQALGKAVFEALPDYPDHGVFGGKDWKAEFFRIPHSGAEYSHVSHFTFLVSAQGKTLYFGGDGEYEAGSQSKALQGRKVDVAIFNPIVTFSEKNLETLHAIGAAKNLICHLPGDRNHGISQKTGLCRERFAGELNSVEYLTSCPRTIEL